MIPEKVRYLIDFILPLMAATLDYLLLTMLGGEWIDNHEMQAVVIAHATVTALVVAAIPRAIIAAKLQEGFAILRNERACLPHELPFRALFGNQIAYWVPLAQPLETTICFYTPNEWRYVTVTFERRLSADDMGRRVAARFNRIEKELEEQLQRTLFAASKRDPSFADFLAEGQLMNDDDINTLKSKLLSVVESSPVPGVEYGIRPETIHLNLKSVRRTPHTQQASADLKSNDPLALKDFDLDAIFDGLKLAGR
ncbi:hypothetical protein D5085_14545 [Ectothiorhodospiraceae bacterium BW-2]|nr:hypothetical protein D5085_14545 [Ectothiorhodospiraceae bacterium BW-2]